MKKQKTTKIECPKGAIVFSEHNSTIPYNSTAHNHPQQIAAYHDTPLSIASTNPA